MEVVAFILERGVVIGLALDGDRTKRCSHGEMHADADLYVRMLLFRCRLGV